jgi:hypothetical protein
MAFEMLGELAGCPVTSSRALTCTSLGRGRVSWHTENTTQCIMISSASLHPTKASSAPPTPPPFPSPARSWGPLLQRWSGSWQV